MKVLATNDEPENIIEELIQDGWEDVDEDGRTARVVNTDPEYVAKVKAAIKLLESSTTTPVNMSEFPRSHNRLAIYQIDGRTIRFFEKIREEKGYGYASVCFWENEAS